MSFKQIEQMYKQIVVYYSAIKRNQSQWCYANWKPQKVIHFKTPFMWFSGGLLELWGREQLSGSQWAKGEGRVWLQRGSPAFFFVLYEFSFSSPVASFSWSVSHLFSTLLLVNPSACLDYERFACIEGGGSVNRCVLIPRYLRNISYGNGYMIQCF